MTKTQDNMANDAAKAAALIKQTAEATATSLNIQYMQKDIVEIKMGIKSLQATQETFIPTATAEARHNQIDVKIDYLTKMIYMGLGGLTALSFLLKFFVK